MGTTSSYYWESWQGTWNVLCTKIVKRKELNKHFLLLIIFHLKKKSLQEKKSFNGLDKFPAVRFYDFKVQDMLVKELDRISCLGPGVSFWNKKFTNMTHQKGYSFILCRPSIPPCVSTQDESEGTYIRLGSPNHGPWNKDFSASSLCGRWFLKAQLRREKRDRGGKKQCSVC